MNLVWVAGADLHIHDGGALDVHWLIKNATYDTNCFMCTNHSSGSLQFHFFDKPPTNDSAGWLICCCICLHCLHSIVFLIWLLSLVITVMHHILHVAVVSCTQIPLCDLIVLSQILLLNLGLEGTRLGVGKIRDMGKQGSSAFPFLTFPCSIFDAQLNYSHALAVYFHFKFKTVDLLCTCEMLNYFSDTFVTKITNCNSTGSNVNICDAVKSRSRRSSVGGPVKTVPFVISCSFKKKLMHSVESVSYTHLTLPTKRIV